MKILYMILTCLSYNSMEKTLERYERHYYAERHLVATEPESQGEWSVEYNRLKAKVELLQKNHRQILQVNCIC
ncbi:hypothetical protein Gorai_016769 [Gossypium raimondii]|uniref:K-box domain-containing protein n=1 Tax=Gossypium raimondii TaxID=29730 RepID=A0A7J8PA09_GOSRA|nr:hypothetical protein [Gossypium raimondii]